MDNDASSVDTSAELTDVTAAPFFESLLSIPEDPQEDKKSPPTPESGSESEEEASTEQADAEEEKSEADETAETDEEQPTEVLYPVKINGVEEMVTLEELRKGYSRTKDYTQKAQTLAEQRRQLEAQFPAVRAEREQLAVYLTRLDEALAEATPAEPDWARVQQEKPDEFPMLWASWEAAEKRRNDVRQQRDEALVAVQRDRDQTRHQYLNDQKAKLIEAIPEWKNAETAKSEKAKLAAFAKDIGFTDEELNAVEDHRAIVMLREAYKWREAQKKKPAIQQKIERVKAATPGAAESNRPAVTDTTRALQRLAKTGKREDAAAAFLKMGIA